MVDHGDVAGPEALDQLLGAPAEAARCRGSLWLGGDAPSPGAYVPRRGALGGLRAAPARGGSAASSPSPPPSIRTISATSSSPSTRSTVARRLAPIDALLDPEVGCGHRGHLGQVGDAEHLPLLAERAQPLADRPRGVAADAGVDLVEDVGRRAARRPLARQREHHPRELAAGGRVAERRDRHPRVGRDAEGRPAPGPAPRSPPGAARARPRALRRSSPAARAPWRPASPARRAALARTSLSPPARSVRVRIAFASSASSRSVVSSAPSIALDLGAAVLGVGEHRLDRAAVLALQAVERVEALLDLLQPARARPRCPRRSRAARRPAPAAPTRRPRGALGELVERRVDALPGGQRRLGDPDRLGRSARPRRRPTTRRERLGGRAAQRLRVAQPLALGGQLGLLRGIGLGRLDLVELVAQQVEVALARPLALADPLQLALEAHHLGVGVPVARGAARGARSPAKPSSVSSWALDERQLAVLVLAVEGEQARAERLQFRRRGGAARRGRRSSCPRAETRRPTTSSVAALRQPLGDLGELGVVEQALGQLEDPLDVGLARPRAGRSAAAPCRPSAGRASGPGSSCRRRSRR